MSKIKQTFDCPFCGYDALYYDEGSKQYYCEACERTFDDDELEHEQLRHQISAICSAHFADEDNPLDVSMPLGENDSENCGLSSLDLPWINSIFLFEDGTMWANVDGYEEPVNFDDISTDDLRSMLEWLKKDHSM